MPVEKLCECGCGEPAPLATMTNAGLGRIKGLPLRFRSGHNMRGRRMSDVTRARLSDAKKGHEVTVDTRTKISQSLQGRPSPHRGADSKSWKGDAIDYSTLHHWLREKHPKTGVCADCGQFVGSEGRGRGTDWANITGIYTRDIANYRELCRACHIRFDRRKRKCDFTT